MVDQETKETAAALRGKIQFWVAVGCIGLSSILGAAWIYSLIW